MGPLAWLLLGQSLGFSVSTISGCTGSGLSTSACPTSAISNGIQVMLTISGTNFPAASWINVYVCDVGCIVTAASPTSISCVLPPGGGTCPVVVNAGPADGSLSLSYAAPSVSQVSGCGDSPPNTLNCVEGATVTIKGSNFGPSGAVALIGDTPCVTVTQDAVDPHGTLTCQLPPGSITGVRVYVIQSGAISSEVVTVSYQSCAVGRYASPSGTCGTCSPGWYSAGGGMDCSPCPPGFITPSSGLGSCQKCARGQFNSLWAQSVCGLCSPGTYGDSLASIACVNCTQGSYSSDAGATACLQCGIGRFQPSIAAASCNDCPIGRSAALVGQQACDVCGVGTYSKAPGQPYCSFCPAGWVVNNTYTAFSSPASLSTTPVDPFASVPTQSACVPCPAGNFAAQRGQAFCLPCDQGSYASAAGSTYCDACPVATYASTTGHTSCDACPAGRMSASTGMDLCEICPVGRFSANNGSLNCNSCPAGTFQNTTGQSFCYSVSPGYYADTPGMANQIPCPQGNYSTGSSASCSPCKAGYYNGGTGVTVCQSCLEGSYTTASGMTACFQCLPGRYNQLKALTTCFMCSPSTYSSNTGMSACLACDPGTYGVALGASKCQKCPLGKFASHNNSNTCDLCPLGTYQDQEGMSFCKDCFMGSVSSVQGSSLCQPCLPGTYAPVNKSTTCSICQPGRFSIPGALGASQCTPCPQGQFSNLERQASCAACVPGKFMNTTGAPQCQVCPPGRYVDQVSATACFACAAGTIQPSVGQASCPACDEGYFSGSPAATVCSQCSIGTYSTLSSTTCTQCLPGKVNPFPGQGSCAVCPAGRSFPNSGGAECVKCAAGRAQSSSGLPDCDVCAPGKVSPGLGAIICNDCEPGYSTNASGAAICQPCDIGRYAPIPASQNCLPCAAGTKNVYTAASTCENCVPGTYSLDGAHICSSCPSGTVQPLSSQSACINCDPGRFASTNGSLVCTDCDKGRYAAVNGSTLCTACEAGSFGLTQGASTCATCPPGRTAISAAASSCELCQSGTFSVGGQQSCASCDRGFYSQDAGASFCTQCAPGRSNSLPKQTSCNSCTTGTYTARLNSSACLSCSPGTFQDGLAQTACVACPVGKSTTSKAGSDSCTVCPARTVAPDRAMPDCLSCGNGDVEANTLHTDCICPAGTFSMDVSTDLGGSSSTGSGSITCVPCPAGASCLTDEITYETLQTAPGWWRASQDTLSFYRCLLAEHCLGGRNSTCALHRTGPLCFNCETGYSSTTGLTPCKACLNQGVSIGVTVIFVIAVFALLIIMFLLILRFDVALVRQVNETNQLERDEQAKLRATGVDVQVDKKGRIIRTSHAVTNQEPRMGLSTLKAGTGFESGLATGSMGMVSGLATGSSSGMGTGLAAGSWMQDSHSQSSKETSVRGTSLTVAQEEAAAEQLKMRHMTPQKPAFTFQMKIIIGFLQIITNLTFILDVPWPSYFVAFLDYLSFVNLNFIPWQSVECVVPLDFYGKLVIVVATPVVLFVVGFMGYWLDYLIQTLRYRGQDDRLFVRQIIKRNRRIFWKFLLFTVFLIYPSISSSILRFFLCTKINDTYYLRADYKIICYDHRWMKYLYVVIPGIIIMPFGAPLGFLALLSRYQHRRRLGEASILLELGFLYSGYTSKHWWWETLDMFHKLWMTSLVAFFPKNYQLQFGMVAIGLYLIMLLLNRPYSRNNDSTLHTLAQTELLIFVMGGWVVIESNLQSLPPSVDIPLSLLFIALTVILILVFAVIVGRTAVSMYRSWQQHKNLKVEEADPTAVVPAGSLVDKPRELEREESVRLPPSVHHRSNPSASAASRDDLEKLVIVAPGRTTLASGLHAKTLGGNPPPYTPPSQGSPDHREDSKLSSDSQ